MAPMLRAAVHLLALACLLAPCATAAASPAGQPASTLSSGRLQEDIHDHEKLLSQSGEQEQSLLDELARLDTEIARQQTNVREIRARIQAQEKVLATKEAELATIRTNNQTLQDHLTKRLRAFYLMGSHGFLNVAFSSRSLAELVLANDSFRSLVTYDQEVFVAYRESLTAIDRARRARELEKALQEKFLEAADREHQELAEAEAAKNSLLKRVRTQKGLYGQALREMRKAEGELHKTLAGRKQAREQQARGFVSNRGALPPPVVGQLVHRFHEPALAAEDTALSNGVTIGVDGRAEVRAVYGGEVIFAGYMRGYGKLVIIDHDLQYCTVSARFDTLAVREGDRVSQGQVLGTTGEITSLFGQGLYFEIRRGTVAEDPLAWFRPGAVAGR